MDQSSVLTHVSIIIHRLQFLALQKLDTTIARESDIVKAHWLYQHYKQTTADNTACSYTVAYLEIESMADQGDAKASKELDPNNPE